MKINYTLEKIMIIALWLSLIVSNTIALLRGGAVYDTGIVALVGLIIVSIIYVLSKKMVTFSLLFLLFFGMIDLATFINGNVWGISFGFGGQQDNLIVQSYSFIFFFVLIVFRRPILINGFKQLAGVSEEDKVEKFESRVNYFKKRFNTLTDEEVARKLKTDLSEEAITALIEIEQERDSTS